MSILATFAQGSLLLIIPWIGWQMVRRIIVKSDVENVPGPISNSHILGNFGQLFNKNGWGFHQQIADQFGKVIGIHGPFHTKQLYIFDSKAMYNIFVKDQYIFEESIAYAECNRILFGDGLLASIGEMHRKQRRLLNPVFAVSHIRELVPGIYEVAHKLCAAIELAAPDVNNPQEIDFLHWMARTALEMIGHSGLGYSFDPLVEGSDTHPYIKAAKDLVPTLIHLAFQRAYLLPILVDIGSPRFRRFVVNLMPWKNVRRLRDIVNVMDRTCVDIFEGKKRALKEGDEAVSKQVGEGKDIMSILMRANMEASEETKLPDNEVLGQMSAFIFGATDTTSNALARVLHLLATHPEAQERLRKEVTEARKDRGDLPYDELVALPFLEAVCRESLRLYPPVAVVTRKTREDVILPLSIPVRGVDGREMPTISIPKDTEIVVSILMANRDPTLWGADSLEWKPERWLSPLPQALLDARIPGVYSHMMTFIGGGRACVGFKFSQVEMKVILSLLISRFRLSSPPNKEIVWEMNHLVTPAVKGLPGKPQLPLIVQLVGEEA